MEAVHTFAPLAARLAARADEIRPVDGAEATWDGFLALFVCAILQTLILLCEALDARAAADARAVVAPAPAARAGRAAMPVAARAPRLARALDIQAISPMPDAALSGTAGLAPVVPWLAWSRHPDPEWAAAGRIVVPPRNTALHPAIKHISFVTM